MLKGKKKYLNISLLRTKLLHLEFPNSSTLLITFVVSFDFPHTWPEESVITKNLKALNMLKKIKSQDYEKYIGRNHKQ